MTASVIRKDCGTTNGDVVQSDPSPYLGEFENKYFSELNISGKVGVRAGHGWSVNPHAKKVRGCIQPPAGAIIGTTIGANSAPISGLNKLCHNFAITTEGT